MPADALSRQPMIEVSQQARRETLQAEATATLEVRPAFPLTMSDQQWKFEQKRDTTCREVRAYVEHKRLSLTPKISNIIKLYGHKATIDQPSGLLHVFTARNKHITSKSLWVPEVLKDMIMTNHHGSTLTGHAGK
jgi:hypothetical protein